MKKSLFTKQMSFIRREMHFYVSVNLVYQRLIKNVKAKNSFTLLLYNNIT